MNPTPTPSTLKKFLLPLVVIVIIIIAGVVIFKSTADTQGAALFRGAAKTDALKMGTVSGSLSPNTGALPCLAGSTTPKIQVISPNGGEVFTAGQQITVKWSTCNIPANAQVGIVLDGNNGAYAFTVLPSYPSHTTVNDGSETITIPTSVTISGMGQVQVQGLYKARVIYLVNSTVAIDDDSDNSFTINGGLARVCKLTDPLSIRVESPNGGETFTTGQQILVRWGTCGGRSDDAARITLTTSFGQGASAVLATVPEQPGYALVTLPSSIGTVPVVPGNYYKIKVDYVDNLGGPLFSTDISNGSFSLQ